MKAKKSRVILSGVSLLLVLCLLVGGTMAWFTDTEKVDTNFTAGSRYFGCQREAGGDGCGGSQL